MSLRDKSRGKRPVQRQERNADTDASKKQKPRGRVNAYFTHHLWVLVSSLGVLWRTPFATFMTAAVIGIALALPAGLHVLLNNVQKLSTGWEDTAQVSLFMKQGVPESRILALADTLRGWDGVAEVRYISREAALKEFQEYSGLGEALDALLENPLPAVLILQPTSEQAAPARMELLLDRLRKIETVDLAQLDMEWVRRLNAIIEVGKRGVLLLTALLALAILLVVGNTIRLTIFNRRQEIVVTKLIGATNAFIRRPFLYTGFWYGLMGAILAWILVGSFMGLLSGPVSHLAALYNSPFTLSGLNLDTISGLLGVGILLGLLGSWIAVGRHLSEIEPE